MSNNSQILNKIAEYQQLYKNLVKKKEKIERQIEEQNYELNCIKSSLGKSYCCNLNDNGIEKKYIVAISNKQDFERKLEFTKKQIEYAENILRNYLLSNLKDEIIEFMILGNKSNVKTNKKKAYNTIIHDINIHLNEDNINLLDCSDI